MAFIKGYTKRQIKGGDRGHQPAGEPGWGPGEVQAQEVQEARLRPRLPAGEARHRGVRGRVPRHPRRHREVPHHHREPGLTPSSFTF